MYNLHCHSLLSDGCLLPSEVAVRYLSNGYEVLAITDHADYSNIDKTIEAILNFTRHWPDDSGIKVLPGIELTHLPLAQFKPLTDYARKAGIKLIVAHGETLVEPVLKGTNNAALEAGIDILAHPGNISDEEVRLAKKNNVLLEITSRKGHSQTNSHVAQRAVQLGAGLVLNTDSHSPQDIIKPELLAGFGRRAGLTLKDIKIILENTERFLKERGVL